jgi:4-amino-4-deoxy-L-arabinose transferase-like glycosyltransferase
MPEPFELSYSEALRAYWRIYWPSQLALFVPLALLVLAAAVVPLPPTSIHPWLVIAAPFAGSLVTLGLFVPRLCSRPYRGFELVLVPGDPSAPPPRLRGSRRLQAAFFLWWRQTVAGFLTGLLAVPTGFAFGIMGVTIPQSVYTLAGLLVIGPLLLKMLIGHPFGTFRIEARRSQPIPAQIDPGSPTHDPG